MHVKIYYFLLSNDIGHARSSTPTFNSMGDGGTLTPCKKLPQPDADHSPPSTADVKNEWNYISTPLSCIHIGHRDNFTLCMYHKMYQLAHRNSLEKISEEINLCSL